MADPIIKKNSAKFDTAHNIQTEADIANKTADVYNLVTGEKYAASDAITVESKSITENGTYTAPAGKAYSPVTVNVESGSGDFVKITLSLKVSTPNSEASFNMDYADRTTEETATYNDAFRIDPEYGILANPDSPYVLYDEPYTGEIYIIKDGCIFVYAGDRLQNTYTVTGAGEIVIDYNNEYAVKVTGDCEITIEGFLIQ